MIGNSAHGGNHHDAESKPKQADTGAPNRFRADRFHPAKAFGRRESAPAATQQPAKDQTGKDNCHDQAVKRKQIGAEPAISEPIEERR
jgi:hypothetical protein